VSRRSGIPRVAPRVLLGAKLARSTGFHHSSAVAMPERAPPAPPGCSSFVPDPTATRPAARRLMSMALGALLVAACAGAPHARSAARAPAARAVAALPQPKGTALEQGLAHYEASEYAEAEAAFRSIPSPSPPAARLGLARVLLATGRYALADTVAADVAGAPPAVVRELLGVRGEALRRRGQLTEVEKLLASAAADPDALRLRLLLGEVLLESGRRSDAEPVLMALIEHYNRDAIDPKDGQSLALVGRAAFLLGSAQDANDAFNQAERAGAADAETLLWRAELFLESYDPGHAEEVVADVLARAPHHAGALARMAQVKLASNLDFDAAEGLARKALAVDPALALADFVLGGVALRDMDLAKADSWIDAGLGDNPRDLDLLSLRAAVRFLADDAPGFERAKAAVLSRNPRYSRLYQIVGDYAEWEHRYEDLVTMMREALLADSDDGKVRAELGFSLIRAGHDADGVASLRRAFAVDPFNVRVFNTLNLYEKEIPRGYETVTRGIFTVRYHKDERAVLDRYVPDLLERAWAKMTKKYGFVPATPIGIELYPSREHFAIRTSGLPQTFIQGVCFGRTLAAMSPKNEHFNIGMTLWHELAHVFHIQLSKNHVPRWFTEGLAEYETLLERPEWRREYDGDLFAALGRGKLPPVTEMNRVFSHAEDMQDMATAYYASTQVVAFIVERWGMARVRRMLELWGDGKRTPDVVRDALGVSPEDLDRDFRKAVLARLARYQGQFTPPTRAASVEVAEAAASAAPKDPEKKAALGLALMGAGEERRARAAVDRAIALDPGQGLGLLLRAQLAKTGGDRPGARAALRKLVAAGHDGYAVRLALASMEDSPEARRAELTAAHELDPLASAPLRQLVELATDAHDEAAELAALRQLVVIEENDGDAYRRLLGLLLARHEPAEARRVGEAAIYVDAESAETHRLYARALAATGARRDALFELESAVRASGSAAELSAAHVELADLLAATGDLPGAARHRKTASELRSQTRTGPI
jgi:tetratricopeptide (TPR) repeat protein